MVQKYKKKGHRIYMIPPCPRINSHIMKLIQVPRGIHNLNINLLITEADEQPAKKF